MAPQMMKVGVRCDDYGDYDRGDADSELCAQVRDRRDQTGLGNQAVAHALFASCKHAGTHLDVCLKHLGEVTAANPMTYASEGLRAALVPGVPHIATWISLTVLPLAIAALLAIGIRGFYRRALD